MKSTEQNEQSNLEQVIQNERDNFVFHIPTNINPKPKFLGKCAKITRRTIEIVAAYNYFKNISNAAAYLGVDEKVVNIHVKKYNLFIEHQDEVNREYIKYLDNFEQEVKEIEESIADL